jgi:hypothetical protein
MKRRFKYQQNSRNVDPAPDLRLFSTLTDGMCGIFLGLLAGAMPAWANSIDLAATGTQSVTTFVPIDSLPLTGTKTWNGTVTVITSADGTVGPLGSAKGTKLTYVSGTPTNPLGHFMPGLVGPASSSATGVKGSTAQGTASIAGDSALTGFLNPTLNLKSTLSLTGALFSPNPCPLIPPGPCSAHVRANDSDPFPFGGDGMPLPSDGMVGIGLTLPAMGNSIPTTGPGSGDWSVTYASWIDGGVLFDPDAFYADNPQMLYSLTISDSGSDGVAVQFMEGSPSGFGPGGLTFTQSAPDIETAVMNAILSGWSAGDLNALSGALDVSSSSAFTIGNSLTLVADLGTPEPGSLLLVATALLVLGTAIKRSSLRLNCRAN